jgi:hypothetical protein
MKITHEETRKYGSAIETPSDVTHTSTATTESHLNILPLFLSENMAMNA